MKSYEDFCQILAFFNDARLPNMVMSRDPEANFKNVLICSNSTFNIRKSHKISGGKALCLRSYQGGKQPPVLLELKLDEFKAHILPPLGIQDNAKFSFPFV